MPAHRRCQANVTLPFSISSAPPLEMLKSSKWMSRTAGPPGKVMAGGVMGGRDESVPGRMHVDVAAGGAKAAASAAPRAGHTLNSPDLPHDSGRTRVPSHLDLQPRQRPPRLRLVRPAQRKRSRAEAGRGSGGRRRLWSVQRGSALAVSAQPPSALPTAAEPRAPCKQPDAHPHPPHLHPTHPPERRHLHLLLLFLELADLRGVLLCRQRQLVCAQHE